jgi:hypothetical protein
VSVAASAVEASSVSKVALSQSLSVPENVTEATRPVTCSPVVVTVTACAAGYAVDRYRTRYRSGSSVIGNSPVPESSSNYLDLGIRAVIPRGVAPEFWLCPTFAIIRVSSPTTPSLLPAS